MTGRPAPSVFRPLHRWERWGLVLLLTLFVLHSLSTGFRSCLLKRRMTDLDAFLRGAWAVRTGGNLYEITDGNGFHYILSAAAGHAVDAVRRSAARTPTRPGRFLSLYPYS